MSTSRGARWRRSSVTFGPVGRVVATLLVLAPVWWFWTLGGFLGIAGDPLWLLVVVPLVLRDVWRPARLPPTEEDAVRARIAAGFAERAPAEDGAISGRPAPPRW